MPIAKGGAQRETMETDSLFLQPDAGAVYPAVFIDDHFPAGLDDWNRVLPVYDLFTDNF